MSTTPNMSIIKPVPLSDSNLVGATEVNTAFDTIDAHNHTSGRGLPITPLALNINSAIAMAGFGFTNLGVAVFGSQGSSPLSAANKLGLYVAGVNGDLYYGDLSGVQIPITSGHQVNVTGVGAISGLGSPAQCNFVGSTFQFYANSVGPVSATMDCGDILLRRSAAAGANAVTLRSPSALAASYALTMPAAAAAANFSAVLSDTSGNLTYSTLADGVTLANTAGVLGVIAASIGTTQLTNLSVTAGKIAANTITSGQIATGTITRSQEGNGGGVGLGAIGTTSSTGSRSSTSYGNIATSNTITMAGGRPLLVGLGPIAFGTTDLRWTNAAASAGLVTFGLSSNGGVSANLGEITINTKQDGNDLTAGTAGIGPTSIQWFSVNGFSLSGAQNFTVMVKCYSASVTVAWSAIGVFAVEL